MDQATLVGPDIALGEEMLTILDGAGIDPVVALMMAVPEYGDWRLALASPSLDQEQIRAAYSAVVNALHGRFDRPLPLIWILPLKDPLIRELRRLFGKTTDVRGMRLGGQTIGNRWVDDAYVYRVR